MMTELGLDTRGTTRCRWGRACGRMPLWIGLRIGLWIGLVALCVPAVALAQPAPPLAAAQEDAAGYDTQGLLNEVHQLGAADLPRLQARANTGDARSQVLLGLAHEMGAAGLMPQPAEAMSWFLKAAAQGIPWAETWAADFYFTGSPGIERDPAKALALYTSAANRGDPRAAFFVGQIQFYGDGVPTNLPEAADWFRQARPADPELVDRMIAFAAGPCEMRFCVSLRQVMGAIMTGSGDRLVDGWDEAKHEWGAAVNVTDGARCGLTSSNRTRSGDVVNYFCDSEPVDDAARGAAMARQLADAVQQALPAGFARSDPSAPRGGPATFFARDGYPHVRVSFNTTPGAAQNRVTLLVGP
jgi:hypothetical protein